VSKNDFAYKLLEDTGFRLKTILEGEILRAGRLRTPLNTKDLISDIGGIVYITVEKEGEGYIHLLALNGELEACIDEIKGLSGNDCFSRLSELLSKPGEVTVRVYRVSEERLKGLAPELTGTVGIEASTRPIAEAAQPPKPKVSISFLEYIVSGELSKLG
jgi:hypothetical protein